MVKIIQGEKKDIPVTLFEADDQGRITGFKDLTGLSAAEACFKNSDGTLLTLTLGSGITVADVDGKLDLVLTDTESDALAVIDQETLEIKLDYGGGDVDKVQIERAYSVIRKFC